MPCGVRTDLGLLVLRAGTGGVLIAHGTQKLFGWFGGSGLKGAAGAMDRMGFRPGLPSAVAAGLGEAGGGLLLALGVATPAAGAAAVGAMAAAVEVNRPSGFFNSSGGYEFPAFLGLVAAGLGLTGPGRYSLDHATGHRLNSPAVLVGAFAGSALAASVTLRRRARVVAERAGSAAPGSGPAAQSGPATESEPVSEAASASAKEDHADGTEPGTEPQA